MITKINNYEQKTSFGGCVPPFKIPKGMVIPIEKPSTAQDILEISKLAVQPPIEQGSTGYIYEFGNNIVKVYRDFKNNISSRIAWDNETNNLDLLRDLCIKNNDKNYLHNTQKGLFGFELNNTGYLFSTKVPGEIPHPEIAPLNKENLSALIEIFERLDKGTDGVRYLHTDLRAPNIKITDKDAGLLDFELFFPVKLKNEKNINPHAKTIEIKSPLDRVFMRDSADTGYGTSNLRSFEYDLLSPYLYRASDTEAKKLFQTYLPLKSNYHDNMSVHYQKLAGGVEDNMLAQMAQEESMHAYLLNEKNISPDIVKAEIDKLQMSFFLRRIEQLSQTKYTGNLSLSQVDDYFESSISNYINQMQKAYAKKDIPRFCYYMNCKDLAETTLTIIADTLKKNQIPPQKLHGNHSWGLLSDKLM